MASGTGPRRPRGAPAPRTCEGPEKNLTGAAGGAVRNRNCAPSGRRRPPPAHCLRRCARRGRRPVWFCKPGTAGRRSAGVAAGRVPSGDREGSRRPSPRGPNQPWAGDSRLLNTCSTRSCLLGAKREEMYEARPLSRSLFLYTFLQNHGPSFLDEQVVGVPGVTNILEFHPEVSPHSSEAPHHLAMQLASIADDLELRLLLPQFAEPLWMIVYSSFFPFSQIGPRDVLRSFMIAFTNLRENRRLRSILSLRDRVSPSLWPELALSLLLVVMLAWR
ncbi:uncharacterized protein LOC100620827 isoform X3 [Sus scrofa]|nr:uncharacterized protein LOC100620827 isoform X3 [Sus scrofa]